MSRKQKGSGCGDYVDPALEYRHCGGSSRKQRGGSNQTYENAVQLLKNQYEVPSDVTNTYLSEKTSELTSHWANPSYPARGGARNIKKQKGAALDYPFESQYNEYPIPNKMNFAIDEGVSTNFVSNKDIYGCAQKGGSRKTNKQSQTVKLQNGGKTRLEDSLKLQNGGDCGCNQPISLGGAMKKKQKGAGYGYNLDVSQAITNRPEVVRYTTEGTGYYGKDASSLGYYGKTQTGGSINQRKQRGGSAASNSLMEYFLDFQHRCRNTEIY